MQICGTDFWVTLINLLSNTLEFAAPLTLGALCGLFCERSGVVNIGIEGLMLTSAFFGFIVGSYSQNPWLGIVGAVISSVILSALHAVLSIRFKVDQIISGTVINIMAIGLTGYLNRLFVDSGTLPSPVTLPRLGIPGLDQIPVLGALFVQPPITWLAVILVLVANYVMYFTRWGLRTRAVGENPGAADTVGINVYFMRYANVLIGGAIAGLAGAYFTLESTGTFESGITHGSGFIALAALIFGKWTPLGLWGAALLFGLSQGLSITFQALQQSSDCQFGISKDVLVMLPYILTILVLAGVVGRAVAPAADGQVYEKGRLWNWRWNCGASPNASPACLPTTILTSRWTKARSMRCWAKTARVRPR